MPDSEPLEYNRVFERLVDSAEDGRGQAIGLIAYGIYKISKRQWVTKFKDDTGARPDESQMRHFASTQTDTNLDGYRAQAEQLLAAYAEVILLEARPKIIKDALHGQFRSSILASIIASFVFSLILLGVALIAAWFGFGFPIQISIPRAS